MSSSISSPADPIRDCAKQVEDIQGQLAMVAELVSASVERLDDDAGMSDRVNALLVAAGHMLRGARRQADALVDRMLNAAES